MTRCETSRLGAIPCLVSAAENVAVARQYQNFRRFLKKREEESRTAELAFFLLGGGGGRA